MLATTTILLAVPMLLAGVGVFLNRRKLPSTPVDVALVFGTGLDWKAESRVRAAANAY